MVDESPHGRLSFKAYGADRGRLTMVPAVLWSGPRLGVGRYSWSRHTPAATLSRMVRLCARLVPALMLALWLVACCCVSSAIGSPVKIRFARSRSKLLGLAFLLGCSICDLLASGETIISHHIPTPAAEGASQLESRWLSLRFCSWFPSAHTTNQQAIRGCCSCLGLLIATNPFFMPCHSGAPMPAIASHSISIARLVFSSGFRSRPSIMRTSSGMRTRASGDRFLVCVGIVLTVGSSFFPGFSTTSNSPMSRRSLAARHGRLHIQLADLRPGSTSRRGRLDLQSCAILYGWNMASWHTLC